MATEAALTAGSLPDAPFPSLASKGGAAVVRKPRAADELGETHDGVSQRAKDVTHFVSRAGLWPTIVFGSGFLVYSFGAWFGPNVWVPWQSKFLGNEQAMENLIKATAVLLDTAEKRSQIFDTLAVTLPRQNELLERVEGRLDRLEKLQRTN